MWYKALVHFEEPLLESHSSRACWCRTFSCSMGPMVCGGIYGSRKGGVDIAYCIRCVCRYMCLNRAQCTDHTSEISRLGPVLLPLKQPCCIAHIVPCSSTSCVLLWCSGELEHKAWCRMETEECITDWSHSECPWEGKWEGKKSSSPWFLRSSDVLRETGSSNAHWPCSHFPLLRAAYAEFSAELSSRG